MNSKFSSPGALAIFAAIILVVTAMLGLGYFMSAIFLFLLIGFVLAELHIVHRLHTGWATLQTTQKVFYLIGSLVLLFPILVLLGYLWLSISTAINPSWLY